MRRFIARLHPRCAAGPRRRRPAPEQTREVKGRLPVVADTRSNYNVLTDCPPRIDVMKTKLVRIGNSRGIRIPKPLLEQAGLVEDVELEVVQEGIMIRGAETARSGWAEAAELVRERREDGLLDEPVATAFERD